MATHTKTNKVLHKLEDLKVKGLIQRLTKGLLKKLQREYDHSEEKRRYFNLMTYLHYFCRQLEEARHCNREALKMDPECIVALANQAWISYMESRRDEVCQEIENIIEKAAKFRTNRVKRIKAMAEIAYSYARFGIKYYNEAEKLYQDVLSEVKDDDRLPSLLWQYGYGLIKRRKLRFHRKGKEYKREVKRSADLLYKVAKQNKTFRFKARALRLCSNWQKLFPDEISNLCEDDMFSMAFECIKKVKDIPALEHYDNYLKRTYQSLAEIKMTMFLRKMKGMNTGQKQNPAACINYCEEVQEILSDYDSSNRIQTNYSAKFLYHIGRFQDAIDVISVLSDLSCKCLLGLSEDSSAIMQAKDWLRSAIEMSFEFQGKRLEEIQLDRYSSMGDHHNSDDDISRDEDNVPKMTELQKFAILQMKHLLQNGEKSTESIIEEIALCEIIKDEERTIELCIELEERGIDIEKQIYIAKQLIASNHFDKGLILLKQMVLSDHLPEQANNFTSTAQIDGALDALIKMTLFRDQEATKSDMLHVFLLAHERNKDATYKLQRLFDNWTKLNITSCFDATHGSSILDNLEDNLRKSYVIAVLMDINDLTIDDIETDVFKKSIRMAQCTQMKHNRGKALVAIKLSEQVDISSTILSDESHVQLQDTTMFVRDFFMQALLNRNNQ
ncbi:hypothetical protein ACJMK2_031954 [Sinanodonta woodiana]|uniref:Uncharacterized protein n=1 Tax=Sinanodonta woodiana TaxID=1069815 RepID=A0ABD3X3R7_SINWO